MCTACAFPKGTKITETEFDNCWDSNKDGGGFAYLDENGKFVVIKSLFLDDLKKQWKEHHGKHGEYSPFLLHFRAASAGKVEVDNCHPFIPNPKTAFIHNGTIRAMPYDKDKSDTRLFSEDFLSSLPHNFTKNKSILTMLDKYLESNNKVVFLNTDGQLVFMNEKSWEKHNGAMFSNTWFKTPRVRKYGDDATGTTCITPSYQPKTAAESAKTLLTPATDTKFPIKGNGGMEHWCVGCLMRVKTSLWHYQDNMCNDCSKEVTNMAAFLRLDKYKVKTAFLSAASHHTLSEYYKKRAITTQEDIELEIERNARKEDDDIDKVLSKRYHELTLEDWDILEKHGVNYAGTFWG